MYPYIKIYHMDIYSDGLSKRPYYPNTLICQSTWVRGPPGIRAMSLLHGILPGHGPVIHYSHIYTILYSDAVTITASTIANSWTCLEIHHLFDASEFISIIYFALLCFPNSTHRYRFEPPLPIQLRFPNLIWLPLYENNIWFESHLNHTQGSPVSARVSCKQFNSDIL